MDVIFCGVETQVRRFEVYCHFLSSWDLSWSSLPLVVLSIYLIVTQIAIYFAARNAPIRPISIEILFVCLINHQSNYNESLFHFTSPPGRPTQKSSKSVQTFTPLSRSFALGGADSPNPCSHTRYVNELLLVSFEPQRHRERRELHEEKLRMRKYIKTQYNL